MRTAPEPVFRQPLKNDAQFLQDTSVNLLMTSEDVSAVFEPLPSSTPFQEQLSHCCLGLNKHSTMNIPRQTHTQKKESERNAVHTHKPDSIDRRRKRSTTWLQRTFSSGFMRGSTTCTPSCNMNSSFPCELCVTFLHSLIAY